jgi:hypothetical protein
MRLHAIVALVCGVLAAGSAARADDWAAPTTKYLKSDSGRFRLVVTPGSAERAGKIALYDDQVATNPRRLYDRRSVNKVAPVTILLADGGQLITLDEWYTAGYAHALVIYDRKGRVVMDCRLEQLLLPAEMASVAQSVSSRWWRAPQHAVWLDKDALNIKSAWGPTLQFDLATGIQTRDGEPVKIPGSEKCRPRRRAGS